MLLSSIFGTFYLFSLEKKSYDVKENFGLWVDISLHVACDY